MGQQVKVRVGRDSRVCQGDVFRDVEFLEYVAEESGIIEVSRIVFPLAVVLTQDCDLMQDFRTRYGRKNRPSTQDKLLLSVLVAPIYNLEHVYLGEHLDTLDIEMEPITRNRTPGKYLVSNQRPRYHYLEFPDSIPIPPSVVDFKHYFSVTVEYLKQSKEGNFVCNIAPLHREDLAQRFAAFLGRIGVP